MVASRHVHLYRAGNIHAGVVGYLHTHIYAVAFRSADSNPGSINAYGRGALHPAIEIAVTGALEVGLY